MSNSANEAIVKSMYENYLKQNIPAVLALFADDIVWVEPGEPDVPFAGTYNGIAGIEQMLALEAKLVKVTSFEPGTYFSTDDQVAVLGQDSAIVLETNKTYSTEWVMVFNINSDSKISRIQTYMDTEAVAHAFQS